MNERVSHDTLLDVSPAGFELRLDQRQQVRRRLQELKHGGKQQPERDEACIDGDEVGSLQQQCRIEPADIGALDGYDLRSLTQA